MHSEYGEALEIRPALHKHCIVDFLMDDEVIVPSENEVDPLH